ncbi:hypothetical protein C1645_814756 [Glomus cerebriforme]|uniref:Integral membrane protein n=1 Tax=Glomus cerebriforme TaxID=658196 RepID=A0A397TPX4_9GLOM|nr:hypothetical protein C1645_814756 [Glomus cerebriforme]
MTNSLSANSLNSGNDPNWPSLYWPPFSYKITLRSIPAGIWAWVVFHKYRWSFLIPIGFVAVALLTGFVSGTTVGLVLAAIYTFGSFNLSVWIPFLWGLIQALILLMGCYSTITTIL